MTLRTSRLRKLALACSLGAGLGAGVLGTPAHAALFSDDEARQAILDLRQEVRQQSSDQEQSRRAQLQLSTQVDQLQQQLAQLRGQIEVLTKQLQDEQQAQKANYTDADARLKKLEPQATTIDGQDATVDPSEKRNYDAAIDLFRNGKYSDAAPALTNFIRQSPQSAYVPVAQFYLGSSYYALKDYKSAIAQQQAMVKNYPTSPRAPDALLVIAGSQVELNDRRAARTTLERIVHDYPGTPAAQTAKDRLDLLK